MNIMTATKLRMSRTYSVFTLFNIFVTNTQTMAMPFASDILHPGYLYITEHRARLSGKRDVRSIRGDVCRDNEVA